MSGCVGEAGFARGLYSTQQCWLACVAPVQVWDYSLGSYFTMRIYVYISLKCKCPFSLYRGIGRALNCRGGAQPAIDLSFLSSNFSRVDVCLNHISVTMWSALILQVISVFKVWNRIWHFVSIFIVLFLKGSLSWSLSGRIPYFYQATCPDRDNGIKSQVLYDCTCLVSAARRSDFLL